MKTTLTTILAALALVLSTATLAAQERDSILLFDQALFYDGYLFDKNPDSLLQDGILRHSTSLYAVRMTEQQLSSIGDSIDMDIWVKACCDNYDRIGNINLAFVGKGATRYSPDSVARIELGRFITPFMNMNKQPNVVPYSFWIDYLSPILRDAKLRARYDYWMEFELFGVPYAANQQIIGCTGRSDVFKGTLVLATSKPARPLTDDNVLIPIVMKKPEYKGANLNNYSEQGTDTLGKTTKTYTFTLDEDVNDAQLVLVTSNHGANAGGEEYSRRWHYVYLDDELILTYKPGRTSCEPFRKYNTQANGIYGTKKRSDATWQSFSNWCPGDAIDNRIIALGPTKAGVHRVRISVPEAVFQDAQGDIPVSLFFQGTVSGTLPVGVRTPLMTKKPVAELVQQGRTLSVNTTEELAGIELYDVQGRLQQRVSGQGTVTAPAPGLFLLNVETADGIIETHKVWVK